LIRHAKSSWKDIDASDFERGLTKKGKKSIETIGSYLMLRGISPDIMIASCVAIDFDIERWSDIGYTKGKMDFFIFPKQFQYYIPNQIRAVLGKEIPLRS